MTMGELEELKAHFKTHNRIKSFQAHTAKVHTVDWNRDGRRLASGSFDKTVCIFVMDNERLVSSYNKVVDAVACGVTGSI